MSARTHIHVGTTAEGVPAMACGIKGSQHASIPLWGGKRDADTCRLCVARSKRFVVPRKDAAHV